MKKKLENIKVKSINIEPNSSKSKSEKKETGGPAGLEPTRYGDWERKGRCIDF